mmetsp:Transcript_12680/g.26759  ORF Transcript_12680/g.26759 Transcript_12680/m.26759 type:complete len:202 (+) Transcript_12680:198-803(+)
MRTTLLLNSSAPLMKLVSIRTMPLISAGLSMSCSSAASMVDCQELVEPGMTKPKSKCHSSKHAFPRKTRCVRLRSLISWADVKLSSRDTSLHFMMVAGISAEISSVFQFAGHSCSHTNSPVLALRMFIQLMVKPSSIFSSCAPFLLSTPILTKRNITKRTDAPTGNTLLHSQLFMTPGVSVHVRHDEFRCSSAEGLLQGTR